MSRQLKGIGLILFGILLVIISAGGLWVPILGDVIGDIFCWGGLIIGIIGVIIVLNNGKYQ